jgi:hypothetical protein
MKPPLVVDMKRLLNAVEDATPAAAVEVMATELARSVDATEVTFLAVDLRGRQLARLTRVELGQDGTGGAMRGSDGDRSEEVPMPVGGRFEQVLRAQNVMVEPAKPDWRVLVPVSERGEAVGILEMLVPEEPDDDGLSYLRSIGHLLAFVVIANRRHTDLFEWGQRSTPFELSAEIQRRLLPGAFTCEAGQFALSHGWSPPPPSAETPTTTPSAATPCISR